MATWNETIGKIREIKLELARVNPEGGPVVAGNSPLTRSPNRNTMRENDLRLWTGPEIATGSVPFTADKVKAALRSI